MRSTAIGRPTPCVPEAQPFALRPPAAAGKRKRGTAVRGTKTWDDAMVRARGQAEQYARALPKSEGWPPFVVIVDVEHSIDLYADLARSGKFWTPFPDLDSFRISLTE